MRDSHSIRAWGAALGLALFVASNGAGPAWAISSLNFRATSQGGVGAVNVNDTRALTLRGAGRSSLGQAAAIAGRLQAAAERGGPRQIAVRMVGGVPAVMLDGAPLVRVTGALAAGNNSTPSGLAGLWAERLEAAFAQPFIALDREAVDVPLGESRTLAVRGNLWAGLTISAPPAIVEARYDPQQQVIGLLGVRRGRTQATIASGGASLTIGVRVAPWAGAISPQVNALVSGRLVTRDLLTKAASFAAYRAIHAEPGARVEVDEPVVAAEQLSQGQQTTGSVRISLSGEEYLPVTGSSSVLIRAMDLDAAAPGVLMVSNRPERLPGLGLWYEGRIRANSSARLLYHHLNGTANTADLTVELANAAATPARLHVIEGARGPSRDEIFVGHAAARTFLQRMIRQAGYIVDLPPWSRVVLTTQRLPPGTIGSGIAQVSIVQGSDVLARVRLRAPEPRLLVAGMADETASQARPFWVFPTPRKALTAEYTVGGKWAFVSVGRDPVSGVNHGETLPGNYGVLYDITYEINNPRDETASLEFAFATAAGAARGVVVINGVLYETGLLHANGEQVLTRFRVPGRSQRRVHVQTMPQSGSNYPIRLVCRPAGSGG